jgi:hypothetical protein
MHSGILAIWNDCLPEVEVEYEYWYMGQHFPERLGVPGFKIGRRYEAVAAEPRYFTFYDTASPEVLLSEAYYERLNNPTPETAAIMKSFRNMSRTVCRRVSQFGHFVAGHVVVARLSKLPQNASQIQVAVMEATGVTGAESWQQVELPDNGATNESKHREGPDEKIGAALVFHVMRVQDALDTADMLSAALDESAQIGAYQLLCELRSESLTT